MDGANTQLDLGLGDTHTRDTDMITLETETWYHVVLTWDSGNYVVYVNGEQIAAGSYTGLTALNNVADIGNNGSADNRTEGFQGRIDDVRIYNYPLGKAEIAELSK